MEAEVQVGKYTLESLTTGMYSDPKIVYREYIQNSVDSLENAVRQGIIEQSSMRIDIILIAKHLRNCLFRGSMRICHSLMFWGK